MCHIIYKGAKISAQRRAVPLDICRVRTLVGTKSHVSLRPIAPLVAPLVAPLTPPAPLRATRRSAHHENGRARRLRELTLRRRQ